LVVAILVCGRFGFSVWPFSSDLWPFWLWPFWFVAVLDVIPKGHQKMSPFDRAYNTSYLSSIGNSALASRGKIVICVLCRTVESCPAEKSQYHLQLGYSNFIPYITTLALSGIPTLQARRKTKQFFRKICQPDNCWHHLLPHRRLPAVISCHRKPAPIEPSFILNDIVNSFLHSVFSNRSFNLWCVKVLDYILLCVWL